MTDDLIERLEQEARTQEIVARPIVASVCRKAAAALRTASERIVELEKEREPRAAQSQPCGAREPISRAAGEAEPSAAFTPGPWEWDAGIIPPDGPGRYADIYIDGGDTIIASFNDMIPEGRANARLIAAAPDLLAELKWCFMGCGNLGRIAAAIAKAEGRS